MDGKDQRHVFGVRLLPILIQGVEVGRCFKWHGSSFRDLVSHQTIKIRRPSQPVRKVLSATSNQIKLPYEILKTNL